MSTKPRPYQIGDTVRILRPRIVRRVGYPLHFRDPEVQRFITQRLDVNLIEAITGIRTGIVPRVLIEGAAKAYVELRAFGGNTRGIHYFPVRDEKQTELGRGLTLDEDWKDRVDVADCTGLTSTVQGKCVRMTGERFAGSGGYDYEGNYDWDNGGLINQQAHVFLYTTYGWIEQTDVELVTESNGQMLGYTGEYRI